MKISSVRIENFRAIKRLSSMEIGDITTIVGKNDSGKSSILYALAVFFAEMNLDDSDRHIPAGHDDSVVIAIEFRELPETIKLEEDVETDFPSENLLNAIGNLEIIKVYEREKNPKSPKIFLKVKDFVDESFQNLCSLKERDLLTRGKEVGLDLPRSGRSITNKSRREAIRTKAVENGISIEEIEVEISPDLAKKLIAMLSSYRIFIAEEKTNIEETSFQNQFQPIVERAVNAAIEARGDIEAKIKDELKKEFSKVFEKLKSHTDLLIDLEPVPEFMWKKLVRFDLRGKDQDGIAAPLSKRGAGIRRLLMVAFFQYLAESSFEEGQDLNYIFAIEEPETFLHPGAQRELIASFRRIAEVGAQVIVTSHSPTFAAGCHVEDLVLISRTAGIADVKQKSELSMEEVASELGVDPSDRLVGATACVFVEGPNDVYFLEILIGKLKEKGLVEFTFKEKKIEIVPCGGQTVKYFIDSRAMSRIAVKYGVLVDSDKKSKVGQIPSKKLNWQSVCQSEGACFYILRKREIENYLHRDAIKRFAKKRNCHSGCERGSVCLSGQDVNDFENMKQKYCTGIWRAVGQMTVDEILQRDKYIDDGNEKHEILEIIKRFLQLVQ